MRGLLLISTLILFGCSEAQLCRGRATSELRRLESQIAETERNVARGYELIERPGRRERDPMWCPADLLAAAAEQGRRVACPSPFPPDPVYEPRPINVEAERAKLASLKSQRERMLPQVQAALAQCPTD